jgi:hypothetical protein
VRNVKARLVNDGRMNCSREHRSRCVRTAEARLVKEGVKEKKRG